MLGYLLRKDKESWLKETQDTSARIAYVLARNNKPEQAVVELERGLASLLSEALAIDRANLEQLKDTEHVCLIDDYQQAVGEWWLLTQKDTLNGQDFADLQSAHKKLDKTIEAIRQVKGYENFLASSDFKDIQVVAKEMHLVYILTTELGGLALIVKKSVTLIWLQELTTDELSERLEDYLDRYSKRQENQPGWLAGLEHITQWLWGAVMEPVIESLPFGAKVTLIPSGMLALLPLHCAWKEDKASPTGRYYALDALGISYSPNARSLAEAHTVATGTSADKMLVVADPRGDLSNSEYEVQPVLSVYEHRTLRHGNASYRSVLDALPYYNMLHFSCHGRADFEEPLSGGLLMADGKILLQDFLRLRLKGVRLAVLSACETGIPGTKLPDEIVHLASGLLQAGAAGVVASLWSVTGGVSGMMLMIRFYDLSENEKQPSAGVLRQAQIWLRDSTNREKLEYFRNLLKSQKITREAFKRIYNETGFSDREARDFAHPFHWAGFQYVGV